MPRFLDDKKTVFQIWRLQEVGKSNTYITKLFIDVFKSDENNQLDINKLTSTVARLGRTFRGFEKRKTHEELRKIGWGSQWVNKLHVWWEDYTRGRRRQILTQA